jgi:hypothetical protein
MSTMSERIYLLETAMDRLARAVEALERAVEATREEIAS